MWRAKALYPSALARTLATLTAAIGVCYIAMRLPAQAAQSWAIDPARTHIGFSIGAVGYDDTHGEFRDFQGRLKIDLKHPELSSAAFSVKSGSVETGSSGLDSYIRTAFFNAKVYPEMTFVSTKVEKVDAHTVMVTGNLTLTGVTRPVTFKVDVNSRAADGRHMLGFTATGVIHRSRFGMIFGLPLVSDEVAITVSTQARAQS